MSTTPPLPRPSSSAVALWLLVRPHERLHLGAVHLAAKVSRTTLQTFLFTARHGARSLPRVSAPGAVRAVVDAYRDVPAYRAFVDQHGGLPTRPFGTSAEKWIAALPFTSKKSYVDAYPVA